MIEIRKSDKRGHADLGWLHTYRTFSFGEYQKPDRMGYRVLRVMNEDRIAPGRGFGPHAHRDMEILTYVLSGSLAHRDSMGERHAVGPNEIQLMSAGHGIVHSEFNASASEPVHLIQIWIDPAAEDLEPGYQQIGFDPSEKKGRFRVLAGPEGRPGNGSAVIRQDASLYVGEFAEGDSASVSLGTDRYGWVQVVRGRVSVNGRELSVGDGAAFENEPDVSVSGNDPEGGEVIVFDLP